MYLLLRNKEKRFMPNGSGPWNYCVRDGIHVRPRWFGSQEIPSGSHRQCTLFPKGCCCPSGIIIIIIHSVQLILDL